MMTFSAGSSYFCVFSEFFNCSFLAVCCSYSIANPTLLDIFDVVDSVGNVEYETHSELRIVPGVIADGAIIDIVKKKGIQHLVKISSTRILSRDHRYFWKHRKKMGELRGLMVG
jgi:hypothetical protein